MPLKVQKRGGKWVLVTKSGSVESHHESYTKAERARRLREGIRHGWRPSGKKATRPVKKRTAKRGGRTHKASKGRRK